MTTFFHAKIKIALAIFSYPALNTAIQQHGSVASLYHIEWPSSFNANGVRASQSPLSMTSISIILALTSSELLCCITTKSSSPASSFIL